MRRGLVQLARVLARNGLKRALASSSRLHTTSTSILAPITTAFPQLARTFSSTAIDSAVTQATRDLAKAIRGNDGEVEVNAVINAAVEGGGNATIGGLQYLAQLATVSPDKVFTTLQGMTDVHGADLDLMAGYMMCADTLLASQNSTAARQFLDAGSSLVVEVHGRQSGHYGLVLSKGAEIDLMEGKHDVAETKLKEAAELVSGAMGENDPMTARVHGVLGRLYFFQNKLDLSVEHIEQALNIMETEETRVETSGGNWADQRLKIDLALVRDTSARLDLTRGLVDLAYGKFAKCVDVLESLSEAGNVATATARAQLGNIDSQRGDHLSAVDHFRAGREQFLHIYGASKPECVEMTGRLVGELMLIGGEEQKKEAVDMIVDMKRMVEEDGGAKRLPFAQLCSMNAEFLINGGNFAEAEAELDTALGILDVDAYQDRPELFLTLWHKSRVLGAVGRRADAVEAIDKSLEVYEKSNGDSPQLGALLSTKANLCLQSGDAAASIELLERAIAIFREYSTDRTSVMQLPLVLEVLGIAQMTLQNLPAGREALEEALELYRASFSEDSIRCGSCLSLLGQLDQQEGNVIRASERLNESVKIFTKAEEAHEGDLELKQQSSFAQLALAACFVVQGRVVEARIYLEVVLPFLLETLGLQVPQTIQAIGLLTQLDMQQANYDSARQRLQNAISLMDGMELTPIHGSLYWQMGELEVADNQMEKAREYYDLALGIAETHLGASHSDVLAMKARVQGL